MIRRDELPLLLTGFLATLSGIGLARFGYTALMPQMVQAGWFSGAQTAYLGAANLLGYLLGALLAATLAQRLGASRALLLCWSAVALSFLGCCVAQPLPLFFFWRLVSGVAGAALMVLGPSLAMAATAPQRRTLLGPLMFSGIGMGALLSATIVPALAQHSLTAVWLALALVSALAGGWGLRNARRLAQPELSAAPAMPAASAQNGATGESLVSRHRMRGATLAVVPVLLAYALDGFGFVPSTVFWVDYLARELGRGTGYAAGQWAVFGLGAMLGPLVAAACATRWDWWRTTLGGYLLKAVAIGLPLLGTGVLGHAVSSFIVGALSPGIAALTSGYLMQLVGAAQHRRMWGYATAAFALAQAAAGYLMAWLYAASGSYRSLFALGCGALAMGALLMVVSRSVAHTGHRR